MKKQTNFLITGVWVLMGIAVCITYFRSFDKPYPQSIPKSQTPNPKSQISNSKFQISNSKFQIPNPQSKIKNQKSKIPTPTDAAGYMEYLQSVRTNLSTGITDIKDVLRAEQQADVMSYNKTATLNMKWQEIGPDNVGGRTRAILYDKNNPDKLYAGSVSGGLWISKDAGAYWTLYNDTLENLAVSCITQAANGDIYFGTGEGFYTQRGLGEGGLMGQGIWKLTAADANPQFKRLPSTWENLSLAGKKTFKLVNHLAVAPNNSQRIYAATSSGGFRMSDDGGTTWFIPKQTNGVAIPADKRAHDVEVASDGTVIVFVDSSLYKSSSGDDGTYVKINASLGGVSRHEFAIAPSNPNYMYCSAVTNEGRIKNIYQSTDKGETWKIIGPGGSATFNPYGIQGNYNNAIAVAINNPQRIFVGGIDLWSWSNTDGWLKIGGTYGVTFPSPYAIHSDIHTIRFHPTNPNICFIGNDGGIYKVKDAAETFPTFQNMNRNYRVTQFYSVAFSGDGKNIMGGTQDNGTQYINGQGNTSMSALEILGGDGMYCDISVVNPDAFFASIYYGEIKRSSDKGWSFARFYDKYIDCEPISSDSVCVGNGKPDIKAAFVSPLRLWESFHDKQSVDSVLFVATAMQQTVGNGNGSKKQFTGKLIPTQRTAKISPNTLQMRIDNFLVTDDGKGNLIGNVANTGINTINYTTGDFDVTFPAAPINKMLLKATYDVHYNAGDTLKIESATSNFPFRYVLPQALNPSESIMIQDVVQSRFAVGLTGSVWLTKDALNFSTSPKWVKIADQTGQTKCMSFSNDGNHLFVGTGFFLYRISNLSSISNKDTSGTDFTKGNQVTNTLLTSLFYTQGQIVTGIAVDANNANHVVVTLGNYGHTDYVYYSTNALSNNPTFTSIQNNLPPMPVYSAVIDKNNSSRIILGTELGIWVSEDNGKTWSEQNTGMARVAVFMVRQQVYDNEWNEATGTYPVTNSGTLYIATHGRGIFKCEDFTQPLGIRQPISNSTTIETGLIQVYPNPVQDNSVLSFHLDKPTDATIKIYNVQGKLIKTITLPHQSAGNIKVPFNGSDLLSGIYFVQLSADGISAAAKMIIAR